jgi:60 kDa SS-A/Ro ribonucleoprotein
LHYLRDHGGTRDTPQSDPIAEASSPQVPNSAGGYAWPVDDWTRLRRFLILGSEGGSYYASERELTLENLAALRACVRADGPRAVGEIVAVSYEGRAPKNDQALYALAYATSVGAREAMPRKWVDPETRTATTPEFQRWENDQRTREAALAAIQSVCRTGTHLFQFVEYAESMRGWGRGLRRAVAGWYQQPVERVAYQAVKYQQRGGWSHRDLLRLAHPHAPTPDHDALYAWITQGGFSPEIGDSPALDAVHGFELAQRAETSAKTAELVRTFGAPTDDGTDTRLPREALRPEHLTDPDVWRALVQVGMPQTALLRNLANMTRLGLLAPGSPELARVVAQLTDPARLAGARVHPLAILTALATYREGYGEGGRAWVPEPSVTAALDRAFYGAFGLVEPTGKRTLVAVDVSGSMTHRIGRSPLTAREGAIALAMVTARAESHCHAVAFSSAAEWQRPWTATPPGMARSSLAHAARTTGLRPLDFEARRLDDVIAETSGLPFGGTDCALPMLYASERGLEVETFVVLTDSETWAGEIHPAQALRRYRERTGIPARLAVVAMASNGFTIADPDDAGMLDCVGFDTATPDVIAAFARGEV